MQPLSLLSVLLAGSLVSALPSPNTSANVKRADVKPVSCGPSDNQRAWPLQSVQGSFDALVSNGNKPDADKPAAGTRPYPRQYGRPNTNPSDPEVRTALDATPGCQIGQSGFKYYEFPLLDPVFTGGAERSQGPDRVIAISQNVGQGQQRSFTYCLAVTHRGAATDAAFLPCTNSP